MALVALPCDLPWWEQLEEHLKRAAATRCVDDLIRQMRIIYDLCDVGLDPEEQSEDEKSYIFTALRTFLLDDLLDTEREHFFSVTLTSIGETALNLKMLKPRDGLQFSLQQEDSEIRINRDFAGSLIAHAFFSTFPRRTVKTHPTLQDFNFGSFFRHLHLKCQKSKLKSVLRYFDLRAENRWPTSDSLVISRRVMKCSERLTLRDWFQCDLPLCALRIRHENRMENADPSSNSLFACFSSRKPGGPVLQNGNSQECVQFVTTPELLVTLLCVEALDDNEALIAENLVRVGKIFDDIFRVDDEAKYLRVCLVDAKNYHGSPTTQYEEENVLRELNKVLVGFGSKSARSLLLRSADGRPQAAPASRRLSPIGESFSSTPVQNKESNASRVKLMLQSKENRTSYAHRRKTLERFFTAENWRNCNDDDDNDVEKHLVSSRTRVGEQIERRINRINDSADCHENDDDDDEDDQFETCGTSPASPTSQSSKKFYSTANSLCGYEYHLEDDEGLARRYSGQLDTAERRNSFAERLRAALQRAQSNCSSDSNYAVDISVTGSSIADPNIRMRRGGSRGFMLENDSFDRNAIRNQRNRLEASCNEFTDREKSFVEGKDRLKPVQTSAFDVNSSNYSFSTDCSSSDLEDVCNRLNRWLNESRDEEAVDDGYWQQQKLRDDDAITQFARNLLKRALSESFVGVELTLDGERQLRETFAEEDSNDRVIEHQQIHERRHLNRENRLKMTARSLSLELVKRNHRLAVKLATGDPSRVVGEAEQDHNESNDKRSTIVVTGNWGCGSNGQGDAQLKLLIQWLAGSVSGASQIIYYTCNHHKLLKLDTLRRILVDRRWNVGDLVRTIIRYTRNTVEEAKRTINIGYTNKNNSSMDTDTDTDDECISDDVTLFDLLISSDEKITHV